MRNIQPRETLQITRDGITQVTTPGCKKQVCSFLWVYYGYPSSYYEGINVEDARYRCGAAIAEKDDVKVDYVAGSRSCDWLLECPLPAVQAPVREVHAHVAP